MIWRLYLAVSAVLLGFGSLAAAAEGLNEVRLKPPGEKLWGQSLPVRISELLQGRGYSKSYALVVGISEYDEYSDLNTRNDAVRMAEHLLKVQNFDYVHIITDEFVTMERIRSLMEDEFPAKLDENDRFLLYWSGHGETRRTRAGDKGYLVLSDSGYDLYSQMVNMDDVRRWNDLLRARQVLFVMDACFSGLAGTEPKSADRGAALVRLLSEPGRHIMTAGTGDQETIVLDRLGMSVFTHALIDGLNGAADASTSVRSKDGVITLDELYGHVRDQVDRDRIDIGWRTNITPQLRSIGDSEGAFFFINPEVDRDGEAPALIAEGNVGRATEAARKGRDVAAPTAPVAQASVTPEARIYGSPKPAFRDCAACPEMVPLPRGSFTMGSQVGERYRSSAEGPLHWVDVAPFAIAKTEVTFDQWMACVAARACVVPDDNGWGRGARPVINVTFAEANAYIGWLNSKSAGEPYRLPSEAEWEYAARAGAMTPFPWGIAWDPRFANGREGEAITPDMIRRAKSGEGFPEVEAMKQLGGLLDEVFDTGLGGGSGDPGEADRLQARTDKLITDMLSEILRGDRIDIEGLVRDLGSSETKPAASFPPNAWGLYDMIGNVLEWTEDCWSDTYHGASADARAVTEGGVCPHGKRVARGGSGVETPPHLRSAQRFSMAESFATPWLGFRPARGLAEPADP